MHVHAVMKSDGVDFGLFIGIYDAQMPVQYWVLPWKGGDHPIRLMPSECWLTPCHPSMCTKLVGARSRKHRE